MTKVLIFIETEEDRIAAVSKEIALYASQNFENTEINGILLTSPQYSESLSEQLKNIGLDNLFVTVDERFDNYAPQSYSYALSGFLRHYPQNIFLMGATAQGRELAPRIAARNNLGLTADCTEIGLDESGKLLATRPTYGGQLMATIMSKTDPEFATIRPGALKSEAMSVEKTAGVYSYNVDISNIVENIRVISTEKKTVKNDLESAKLIVAGGLGLKNKENFDLIYEFAELIGAQPAASRAAVELGWAEAEIQVGQTGHTVSPKLYLAFGISGAMQHLVGISGADRIIAVNTDKNAPIFEFSDSGILADASETLKQLIAVCKQL